MRALILFAFLGTILLLSCKGESARPSDILPPEKFQSVVWDLIRADHFITTYEMPHDSSLNKTTQQKIWYGRVLAYHKVAEETFKKSMLYYQRRPSVLSGLMDSLSHKTETPLFQTKKNPPAVVN